MELCEGHHQQLEKTENHSDITEIQESQPNCFTKEQNLNLPGMLPGDLWQHLGDAGTSEGGIFSYPSHAWPMPFPQEKQKHQRPTKSPDIMGDMCVPRLPKPVPKGCDGTDGKMITPLKAHHLRTERKKRSLPTPAPVPVSASSGRSQLCPQRPILSPPNVFYVEVKPPRRLEPTKHLHT